MTGWLMVTLIVLWVATGFLAVLIDRGSWKRFYYEHAYVGWSTGDYFLELFIFLTGLSGLLTILIYTLTEYGKIHLAFTIPKEIRHPTRESKLLGCVQEFIDITTKAALLTEIDRLASQKKRIANQLAKRVWI